MSAPCATCRHNAGRTCGKLGYGLTLFWWRWGGKLPPDIKPGRAQRTCPRWEAP